ncbi:MAG TPA: hypothetical protein VGD81_03880 [Opitutaceae bacterium]
MNTQNACGFVSVGLAMWLLPLLMPTLVEPVSTVTESTRALWLLVMGAVNAVVGSGWLLHSGWLRWQPRVAAWTQAALPNPVGERAASQPAHASEPARLAA